MDGANVENPIHLEMPEHAESEHWIKTLDLWLVDKQCLVGVALLCLLH